MGTDFCWLLIESVSGAESFRMPLSKVPGEKRAHKRIACVGGVARHSRFVAARTLQRL